MDRVALLTPLPHETKLAAARHPPARGSEISRAWTLSRRLSAMGGLSQSWDACQPAAVRPAASAAA